MRALLEFEVPCGLWVSVRRFLTTIVQANSDILLTWNKKELTMCAER